VVGKNIKNAYVSKAVTKLGTKVKTIFEICKLKRGVGLCRITMPLEMKSGWRPTLRWGKRLSVKFIRSILLPLNGCANSWRLKL